MNDWLTNIAQGNLASLVDARNTASASLGRESERMLLAIMRERFAVGSFVGSGFRRIVGRAARVAEEATKRTAVSGGVLALNLMAGQTPKWVQLLGCICENTGLPSFAIGAGFKSLIGINFGEFGERIADGSTAIIRVVRKACDVVRDTKPLRAEYEAKRTELRQKRAAREMIGPPDFRIEYDRTAANSKKAQLREKAITHENWTKRHVVDGLLIREIEIRPDMKNLDPAALVRYGAAGLPNGGLYTAVYLASLALRLSADTEMMAAERKALLAEVNELIKGEIRLFLLPSDVSANLKRVNPVWPNMDDEEIAKNGRSVVECFEINKDNTTDFSDGIARCFIHPNRGKCLVNGQEVNGAACPVSPVKGVRARSFVRIVPRVVQTTEPAPTHTVQPPGPGVPPVTVPTGSPTITTRIEPSLTFPATDAVLKFFALFDGKGSNDTFVYTPHGGTFETDRFVNTESIDDFIFLLLAVAQLQEATQSFVDARPGQDAELNKVRQEIQAGRRTLVGFMMDHLKKYVDDCFMIKDLNGQITWTWGDSLLFRPDHFYVVLSTLTIMRRVARVENVALDDRIREWYETLTGALKDEPNISSAQALSSSEAMLPPRSCAASRYGKAGLSVARFVMNLGKTFVASNLFNDYREPIQHAVQRLGFTYIHKALYFLARFETDPVLVRHYRDALKDVVYPYTRHFGHPLYDLTYAAAMGGEIKQNQRAAITRRLGAVLHQFRSTPAPFDNPDTGHAQVGTTDTRSPWFYYSDYRKIVGLRDPLFEYLNNLTQQSDGDVQGRYYGIYQLGPGRIPLSMGYPNANRLLYEEMESEEAEAKRRERTPNYSGVVFGDKEVDVSWLFGLVPKQLSPAVAAAAPAAATATALATVAAPAALQSTPKKVPRTAKHNVLKTYPGYDYMLLYWLGRYHGFLP